MVRGTGIRSQMIIEELQSHITIEIVSLLIVLIVSFYIFNKTKDLVKLTGHKGIDYFRKAFLFFGLGAGLGVLMNTLLFFNLIISYQIFGIGSMFFIAPLLSLIAILYLIFSIFPDKLKNEMYLYLGVFLIFLFSAIFNDRRVIILIHLILLLIVFIGSYFMYKNKKNNKKILSKTFVIYQLLFVFWLVNFLNIRAIFTFYNFTELFPMLSSLIFIYILYVFKKSFVLQNNNTDSGNKKNKKRDKIKKIIKDKRKKINNTSKTK